MPQRPPDCDALARFVEARKHLGASNAHNPAGFVTLPKTQYRNSCLETQTDDNGNTTTSRHDGLSHQTRAADGAR